MQNALMERHLIEILDPAGRVIWNKQIEIQASIVQTGIDLSAQAAGLYFVRVSNGESSTLKKLILVD